MTATCTASPLFRLAESRQAVGRLDFKKPDDLALLHRLIGKADVLIQNLAPVGRARGLGSTASAPGTSG